VDGLLWRMVMQATDGPGKLAPRLLEWFLHMIQAKRNNLMGPFSGDICLYLAVHLTFSCT
jgi:hypothetical protein